MEKQIITYYCYSCDKKTGCVKVKNKVHNQYDCVTCENPDNCNSDGNITMVNYTHKCGGNYV
jgi:flavoprotein